MTLPVAVTMGCPVGIGPEITLRLFTSLAADARYPSVVLGDLPLLQRLAKQLNIDIQPVSWLPGAPVQAGTMPVFELSNLDPDALQWGCPTRQTSRAMADYIRTAALGALNGDFAAMVTCPISKKSLNEAGIHYPGHTEMLAELTGSTDFRMMMAGSRMKVVLVTIHEPLARVSELLSVDEIRNCIRMTAGSLQRDFGISRPRIAVAGLNPHGGEQGMFGSEEHCIIEPAVRDYDGAGVISGPWPPDTVYYKAACGDFDAVIAMYHDQGLIPFKLLHFQDGVNVTLGLPIVRTSVDHGTAYDIAGQGRADAGSLQAAWGLAVEITENRTTTGNL